MIIAEGAEAGLYHITIDWPVFISQLVGFAVIVWAIVKWVAPAVRNIMHKQQEVVRTQLVESEQAAARLVEAKQAHEKAVADAEKEATTIRADARGDAERITAQLREAADAEVARVGQHGRDQVALARQQMIRQLKADLGAAALSQADQQVRDHLGSTPAKSDSVDRFLDELEAMAAGSTGRFAGFASGAAGRPTGSVSDAGKEF